MEVERDGLNHIIEQAKDLGHKVEVISNIKSGKEATVYKVKIDGQLGAMKVYKKPEERSFTNTGAYLLGKYYRRPSERKAVAQDNKFGKKLKHRNWVKREFSMLKKLFESGANIPEPLLQVDDAIFMELLGDESSIAPRLCDIKLEKIEAEEAFDSVIESIEKFWGFGIVHADLSEYNILWWNSKPYIIDFPQSIDIRLYPDPKEVLDRDIKNVVKYFSKYIDIDPQRLNRFR